MTIWKWVQIIDTFTDNASYNNKGRYFFPKVMK